MTKKIVNPNGSLYAEKWTHDGKKYKFTMRTESSAHGAIESHDEILCETDNKRGMFPRWRINGRFRNAEITKIFKIEE